MRAYESLRTFVITNLTFVVNVIIEDARSGVRADGTWLRVLLHQLLQAIHGLREQRGNCKLNPYLTPFSPRQVRIT